MPARGPGIATPHDVRILADVAEGRGKIIDSETEVGGYPNVHADAARVRRGAVGFEDDGTAFRRRPGC